MKTLKILYFCDMMGSMLNTPEEEFKSFKKMFLILTKLRLGDKKFKKLKFEWEFTYTPPFCGEIYYDILVFDWGGMNIGNNMLEHFSRYLLKDAENYPDRHMIVNSLFSEEAVIDAIREMGKELKDLHNIHLKLDNFLDYLEKYYEIFLS